MEWKSIADGMEVVAWFINEMPRWMNGRVAIWSVVGLSVFESTRGGPGPSYFQSNLLHPVGQIIVCVFRRPLVVVLVDETNSGPGPSPSPSLIELRISRGSFSQTYSFLFQFGCLIQMATLPSGWFPARPLSLSDGSGRVCKLKVPIYPSHEKWIDRISQLWCQDSVHCFKIKFWDFVCPESFARNFSIGIVNRNISFQLWNFRTSTC